MDKIQFTSKEYFNSLNITYMSLILGQVFFAIISLFLSLSGLVSFNLEDSKFILIIVTILFAFGAFYGNTYIFKMKLNAINPASSLFDKLNEYRSACILRWAILEGPSFLSIIGYFLTGDLTFIIITSSIIAFFFMNRPNAEKACTELNLEYQDKIRLMDPDSVISEGSK
jgi:hypothetical protein